MAAFPPNTFATQSGNVPAAQLDANFAACFPLASATGPSVVGNPASGNGNNQNLTPAAAYAILETAIVWEVVCFMSGKQTVTSQMIMRYQPSTAVTITQASCLASAGVAAGNTTVFTMFDNGESFGNITFAASGSVGNVSIPGSPYTVAAGDVLVIDGPVTADTNLSNVNVTLGGNRGT